MTKADGGVSGLRQVRRHEKINGSKPPCPSGDPQTSVESQRRSCSEHHLPLTPALSLGEREIGFRFVTKLAQP